jgi:hypothetical protein
METDWRLEKSITSSQRTDFRWHEQQEINEGLWFWIRITLQHSSWVSLCLFFRYLVIHSANTSRMMSKLTWDSQLSGQFSWFHPSVTTSSRANILYIRLHLWCCFSLWPWRTCATPETSSELTAPVADSLTCHGMWAVSDCFPMNVCSRGPLASRRHATFAASARVWSYYGDTILNQLLWLRDTL